ncbi:MAG TPA: class I SAM-dependent methyltransferase [Tepidisphaeraceae bacterium]|jgi:demethylmenaquinone methyltransferase/2-methoxy-6-polyprenyl-1,4-benzoquinol methylase
MSLETPPALAPHPTLHRYYAAPETKRQFLKEIFDHTAGDYDRVEKILGLGTGSWYRRRALLRAGLAQGMRVLDVAVGTGLVAREEIKIVGSAALVLGVDPSVGMLSRAVKGLSIAGVLGVGEQLPVRDQAVDFLSMGYALRHLGNLQAAFAEYHRVLKPGGRLCILEITRPRGAAGRVLIRGYMRWVVPALSRMTAASAETKKLWEYYSDTIEACIEPEKVMEALRAAGFDHVKREVEIGIFSEYTATRSTP